MPVRQVIRDRTVLRAKTGYQDVMERMGIRDDREYLE